MNDENVFQIPSEILADSAINNARTGSLSYIKGINTIIEDSTNLERHDSLVYVYLKTNAFYNYGNQNYIIQVQIKNTLNKITLLP